MDDDTVTLAAAQERLLEARARARTEQALPVPVAGTPPRRSEPAPTPPRNPATVLGDAAARLRAWQESPEGRTHMDRARTLEAERVQRELLERCGTRGVPAHPLIRALVCDPDLPRTPALVALEEALAWRSAQTTRYGAPPLVVVLAGPPGVGKTTALARLVARWPRTATMALAREIAEAPGSWDERASARHTLGRVHLLALDEVGAEDGPSAAPRLAALIRERYDRALITVASTNLDAGAFVARYLDDRLVSRLAREQEGAGQGWWCALPDGDLRDPMTRAELGVSHG